MAEMSKAEAAAFAAMQNETSAPANEPEPAETEAEPESAELAADGEEGEAPEGEDQPKPVDRGLVPHAAFHEERRIRQQLEAENRRLSEERARFDERLKVIQEMNRPQPELPPQKPDRNVDPIATIEYLEKKIADLEENWQHGSRQWTEAQQQAEQVRRIAQAASSDADRVKAEKPDYDDAYRFWLQSRAGEMQAYGLHPSEIGQALQREELEISAGAFQRGVSPAETLYTIAQQRGFKGGKTIDGRASNGAGAAEHIQRVATGQARNQTLSGTGGGAAPVQMTADRLIAMSADEFDTWTSKNPAATQRLMGKEPKRGRA